jgi:hypothetical protein
MASKRRGAISRTFVPDNARLDYDASAVGA